MNLDYHHMPRHMFDALAAGRGGLDAVRELAAAEYSKHLILLRGVLTAAQGAGDEQARCARRGYELLTAVHRHDAAAAEKVIRHPSVGAWALRTIQACRGGQQLAGAEPRGLTTVAIAAAIRARMPVEIEVTATNGRVVLPSLGAAIADGHTAVVRTGGGTAEVSSAGRQVKVPGDPHRDAPGWLPLRQVQADTLSIVIDDLDPFRMPGSANLAPRLSAIQARKWAAIFQQAWPLLGPNRADVAAEIAEAIAVIVPLNRPARGQVSTSARETFGAIALSESPDPCTCAVTLAHEVQHVKLSALLDIVALTMPDDGRRYYAPWRDDPRPISGLLQGAYAYLGVSGFWRRQRQLADSAGRLRADREFARWREGAARAVETLRASGRLTPAGLDFVRGMKRTLAAWQVEPVPAAAQIQAWREAQLHLDRWRFNNGPIPA
jgi:uncharacterized protein